MSNWWHMRVHASWIIAFASAGFLAGVALAPLANVAIFAHISWPLTAIIMLCLCLLHPGRRIVTVAIIAGLLFGLWRGSIERFDLSKYAPYYGATIQLSGSVAEDVTFGPSGDIRIRLSEIKIQNKALRGQIWMSAPSTAAPIKRGDALHLEGTLDKGFGSFSAAIYRAKILQIERPNPGDIPRQIRDWFADGVRRAIAEPEANLGIGFLTGQQNTLPHDLQTELQLLGLTHIVVASGYNLTILVRLARRGWAKISRYLATLSASVMTASFVLITGFSPSMARAALVTGLSLAAWHYGRAIHPVVLLLFAAAIIVVINPVFIWGDIGWYLSFTSFVGVIMLAPLLHRYFWGSAQPGMLRQIIIDTSAAQLVTLPIIAFVFNQYSPLSLLANLLIVPLVPLAMLLTFIAGVISLMAPGVAMLAGWPASSLLEYMTAAISWLANLPFAQAELTFGTEALVLSYCGLTFATGWLWYKTKYNFRQENIVE